MLGEDNFKLLQTRKYRCCFCFCPAGGGGGCWRGSSWRGCPQCPLSADMFVPRPSHLATQSPCSGWLTAASQTRISQFALSTINQLFRRNISIQHLILAGSPGRVKSTFKYGDPLKIFVLMFKKSLRQ